jgi:hypothetical protein
VLLLDVRSGGGVASSLPGGFGLIGSIGGTRVDDWGTDIQGGSGVSPTSGGGSVLDPLFNPDLALEINAAGGIDYFVNIIDLTLPNDGDPDIDRFLGFNAIGGSPTSNNYSRVDVDSAKGHGGPVVHAFDNSNVLGVSDSSAAAALTATTGLELLLSAEFLASDPGHSIKGLAFITNGGGEYLSNQFLGQAGLGSSAEPGSAGGIGGLPLFDAREFAGNQFFVISIPEPGGLSLVGCVASLWLSRKRRAGPFCRSVR